MSSIVYMRSFICCWNGSIVYCTTTPPDISFDTQQAVLVATWKWHLDLTLRLPPDVPTCVHNASIPPIDDDPYKLPLLPIVVTMYDKSNCATIHVCCRST
mmetsp:Transcript_16581/g.24546  ORF Transcript_16581/g.24546 Transcript_16581/m.24546 type:complete len:100 (-) Transcript_16581:1779-2078(-)